MSRRTRQCLSLAALSLLAAAPPLLADNTAYYFVGPDNSLYSDPANWSSSATGPGGTPPGNGDLAFVTPSAPLTVTLDATPNGISLRQATFQGPSAGGSLVVNSSAPSFVEDVVSIGPNVSFNQTAGVIRGIRGTSLTGPNTSYSLSGSSTVLYGFGFDIAGGVSFTQSGGQVYSVNGIRVGGRHPGDAGADSPTSYALSDGSFGGDSLTFDGPAPVSLTQTGGSVSSYYFTVVGRNASYSLAAGTLSTSKDALFIGSHFSLTGTYAADAGSTFAQSGGTLSLAQDLTPGSSGLVVNANPSGAPALYTMSAGSILLPRNTGISIGPTTSGTFIQTGGSIGSDPASAPSLVTLGAAAGSSGTYSLSGTGVLHAGQEYVGKSGSATFTQSGGTHDTESTLYLAYDPGSSATYSLSAGQLNPYALHVAESGTATLDVSGSGTLSVGDLTLAAQPGSAATLNLAADGTIYSGDDLQHQQTTLAASGSAVINHSAGTLNTNGGLVLYLAKEAGSSATYNLSGSGTLIAHDVIVGERGAASFNQTGGTAALTDTLSLAALAGSSASYTLTGGSLSATSLFVGYGGGPATFAQFGGSASFAGAITVGGGPETSKYTIGPTGPNSPPGSNPHLSAGSITLDGPSPSYFVQNDGSSSVGSILVGRNASFSFGGPYAQTLSVYGSILVGGVPSGAPASYPADAGATFTQYGGYGLWADAITVNANPGSSARFNLSGGNLYFPNHANLTVGSTTTGTFVQTGGGLGPYWFIDGHAIPNYPTTVTLGKSADATGTYSLSGTGTLLTQALVVGDAGAGTFVQSDGSASAVNLTLAAQPGSSASYTLSGGSLRIAPFTYGAPFSLIVADQGIATFTQTGGSLSTGRFYLAKSAGSSATYNLSGGTLDASPVVGSAGTAYLRQTGGTLTATDLTIADQPGSASSIYDLLGGSLTAPTVTNNGTFYMQPPASFAGRTFTNNRSATLDGTQVWPAGSTFTNTLVAYVHSDPAGPAGTPDSATLHFASASPDWAPVVFDAPATHLASLALSAATHATLPAHPPAAAPRLLSTRALSITDTAQLDLADNTLLLAYGDTPSPLDTLRQYLLNARLTSSAADPTHRLGYLDTGSAVTVSLTLTGDTNLDGVINADDYALLDRSYARSMTNAHWTDGDFNYDGTIDQQDYLLIDTTLGQAQGFSPGFLSTRESQFGAPYVSALLAAVPEPSLLLPSILYLLPASLLPRRRRRRRTLKIRRTFQ